jgi:hypothetical protein
LGRPKFLRGRSVADAVQAATIPQDCGPTAKNAPFSTLPLATGFSIDVRPDDADEFGKVFARAFEEVDLDDINTVSIQRNDPRDRPDDTGEHP